MSDYGPGESRTAQVLLVIFTAKLMQIVDQLHWDMRTIKDPDRAAEVKRVKDEIFTLAGKMDRIRLGWNAEDAKAK